LKETLISLENQFQHEKHSSGEFERKIANLENEIVKISGDLLVYFNKWFLEQIIFVYQLPG